MAIGMSQAAKEYFPGLCHSVKHLYVSEEYLFCLVAVEWCFAAAPELLSLPYSSKSVPLC